MFSVSFLAWPSTSAMENAKQNSTIFINTCLYLLISLPLFFVRIFHLQGRVGVGRVDRQVGQVEEQRGVGRMGGDDLLRLSCEDVRGVVPVVLPGHAHVPPEVEAPASLGKVGEFFSGHSLAGLSV